MSDNNTTTGFHTSQDRSGITAGKTTTTWSLSYDFSAHFHPYVQELMKRLIAGSVQGLQDADTELVARKAGEPVVNLPDGKTPRPALYRELFSTTEYKPTALVGTRPVAELDFDPGGAYAVYNWELFFHVPVTIAVHLSNNGRYEEAQRWFHFVFDPTDDSAGLTPERFWKTKPFQTTDVASIEKTLMDLHSGATAAKLSVAEWQDAPFRPHLVAASRPSAYMIYTMMAYLDNLIAWGDALFRQDTGESIGEATQLYVLAANLLGTRPQQVPTKGTTLPQTYDSLRQLKLDPMSNALVKLENALPFDQTPPPGLAGGSNGSQPLDGLGRTLYFCVPPNDKLLGYWDTVADRLFKIRNSLSLAGAFRQLPLSEPQIDPALLARAVAAGVDVAAVIAGINQPAPLVRFGVLAAKAAELCQEVKSLGGALLSAIEKQDGEALAALRARHETATLALADTIKYAQWQEAIKNREALEASLAIAQARYTYYQRLLGTGRQPDGAEEEIKFGRISPLDTASLEIGQFTAEEPGAPLVPVDVDIDPSALAAGGGPAEGKKISTYEAWEMKQLEVAQIFRDIAAGLHATGAVLNLVPNITATATPIGVGVTVQMGGINFGSAISGLAAASQGFADRFSYEATKHGKIGSYVRREQEWKFQSNAAAGDAAQINKQLRAAQIREFMAEREHTNHGKQFKQAEEVEQFLAGEAKYVKTTTTAYYALLRRQVRGLYNRCYELAMETARKAERALQRELGDPSLTFIQPSYLAGSEGLLAGEKLHLDVRRMELAYVDLNRREYELTKHVSLLQLDPWALIALRATGRATVTIPEELFDLDTPGHYFRRIKSVAVSIPCVAGPYTGVACTTRLLRSRIRTSPQLPAGNYPADPDGDSRFDDEVGSTEAVVTSSGSNDSGLFETNLRDERVLPFEYRGAIGQWQLELPTSPKPFDYNTITDVVLHIRYTARDGGEPLRTKASEHLRKLLAQGGAAASTRLLSVRHEFPTAWARFTAMPAGTGTAQAPRAALTLDLRREHYPYFAGVGAGPLAGVDLVARPSGVGARVVVANRAVDSDKVEENRSVSLTMQRELGGLLAGSLGDGTLPAAGESGWGPLPPQIGEFTLHVDNTPLDDLFILLTWKSAAV